MYPVLRYLYMSPINRSTVRKVKLTENKSDYAYWIRQPETARLAALENIREEYNNWKFHDQQRFQRIYRVIKQK